MSETRMIELDGLTFRCRIDGAEGKPWLAFSNSLMTDLTLWDGQIAAFADRFRILRYDQRGHGQTSVPSGDCTFDQLAGDVAALFDALDIARAHVVGISMGAATALRFAALFPGRVDKLVLADGQAATPPGGAKAWDDRIAIARDGGGMAALVEPTVGRWFRADSVAAGGAGLDAVRRMIAATPFDGFRRAAYALQHFDFREDLGAIQAKSLLMVGDSDGALPATMRGMADAMPNAEFVEIEGAGHLPNIEQPARFNAALAAFLDRP